MKSRMILALLLVFSAGLVQPLHANECSATQPQAMDLGTRGTECSALDDGPGDTGETQGDPDGWLGGQNLRPPPPPIGDTSGNLMQAPAGTGGLLATLMALLQLFRIF